MKIKATLNLILLLVCISFTGSIAQIIWTQKTNFTGTRYEPYAFSIGAKGYVGAGLTYNGTYIYPSDFWEYDPSTNAWTQKATFAGNVRFAADAFTLGQKGYVCMGRDASGNYLNDLWEYDPGANTWIQKASFPGAARYTCSSFVIGNYAYAGMGKNTSGFFSDFYKYNPATNLWNQIADIPGVPRQSGMGFTIAQRHP